MGDLAAVAPILTNFFLVTYTLTNLAAFFLAISGVPNYRPHFRYSHPLASLAGAVLTLVAMIYLNPYFAAITVAFVLALFVYIQGCFAERAQWVDISYALAYKLALNLLRSMRSQRRDAKYWRPALALLLPSSESESPPDAAVQGGRGAGGQWANLGWHRSGSQAAPLVGCFGSISRGAPLILGRAVSPSGHSLPLGGGDAADCAMDGVEAEPVTAEAAPAAAGSEGGLVGAQRSLHMQVRDLLHHLPHAAQDSYPQLVVGPTVLAAVQNLVLGAGLGALSPDALVLPLPSAGRARAGWLASTVREVVALRRNALVAANFASARAHECWGGRRWQAEGSVDVWLLGRMPDAALAPEAHEHLLRRLALAAQYASLAADSLRRRPRQCCIPTGNHGGHGVRAGVAATKSLVEAINTSTMQQGPVATHNGRLDVEVCHVQSSNPPTSSHALRPRPPAPCPKAHSHC